MSHLSSFIVSVAHQQFFFLGSKKLEEKKKPAILEHRHIYVRNLSVPHRSQFRHYEYSRTKSRSQGSPYFWFTHVQIGCGLVGVRQAELAMRLPDSEC